jgi:gamma-glutamyltranspeptidase/glutathione hydrolase
MTPQQAVAAGRFHHQLLPPDHIIYSQCCALPADTLAGLRAIGYKPEVSPWEFGDLQVIAVDDAGTVSAGSDPRGRGVSLVEDVASSPAVHQGVKPRAQGATAN